MAEDRYANKERGERTMRGGEKCGFNGLVNGYMTYAERNEYPPFHSLI